MKRNNKINIILSIFALVSLFLAVFLVLPLLSEIKKDSEDLVSAKNSVVALVNQADQIENFKNNYQIYKQNLEK